MPNVFITGSQGNKNKIFVTAGIVGTMQSLGFSCGVYKPIETGVNLKESKDLTIIKAVDKYINTYFTYRLEKEDSPLLSAAAEGLVLEQPIILQKYQSIMNKNEILIVDGISGFGTPIAKDFLEEDLVKTLEIPLIFAISAQSTDINNILLSINRAKEMNIEVNGVIINDYTEEKKLLPKLIEEYSGSKILGVLPVLENDADPSELISETINNINLEDVFKMKIAKL